jgi:uncharacterized protein (TIGR03435 family)
MRLLVVVIPLVTTIAIASAQAPASPQPADASEPSFEVTSIKMNKGGNMVRFPSITPGRFTATNMSLRLVITQAYQLRPDQLQGAPGWLDSDRFDIVAKAPDGASTDQMRPMLRSLLRERFKLVVHRETKESPIYALMLARSDGKLGPKLTKTTDDCDAILAERIAAARARGPGPVPFTPPGLNERPICTMRTSSVPPAAPGSSFVIRYSAGGQPMESLTGLLSGFVNRLVVDRTGLAGLYDYELEYSPVRTLNTAPLGAPAGGQAPVAPIDDAPTVFESLKQLGLKLESTRGPVEYLVVDSVEHPVDD